MRDIILEILTFLSVSWQHAERKWRVCGYVHPKKMVCLQITMLQKSLISRRSYLSKVFVLINSCFFALLHYYSTFFNE